MNRIITSSTLTQMDKVNAEKFVLWLKRRKFSKQPPITQKQFLAMTKDKIYNEHSFPAIINYCRLELDEWIVSSNEGIFYAETDEEKKKFIEYFESITIPRLEILRWAKKKLSCEQQDNQIEIVYKEKEVEEKIYGGVINELETKLGAIKKDL